MYSLAVYETARISCHPAVMNVSRPSDDYCHLMDTECFLELKYVDLHVYSVVDRQTDRHLVSFVGEKCTYRGRLTITESLLIVQVCACRQGRLFLGVCEVHLEQVRSL
jgi:hypothetical protein